MKLILDVFLKARLGLFLGNFPLWELLMWLFSVTQSAVIPLDAFGWIGEHLLCILAFLYCGSIYGSIVVPQSNISTGLGEAVKTSPGVVDLYSFGTMLPWVP